jgi:hypothetical protein
MRLRRAKTRDVVSRPSWRSSLLGAPSANFHCGKPNISKNSLNFVSTCLRVVDTRRTGDVQTGFCDAERHPFRFHSVAQCSIFSLRGIGSDVKMTKPLVFGSGCGGRVLFAGAEGDQGGSAGGVAVRVKEKRVET